MKNNVELRLEEFRQEVKTAGEELRNTSFPPITEELFGLYEKTGNRLAYEAVYFGRRKALAVFGLLAVWYRRREDIDKLCEIIVMTCGERTWALPAHVDRSEPGWERTVDLFACETGQTLSELVTLLQDEIPREVACLVKRHVTERLIDSYLEQPFGTIRWEKFKNNWVAVCAGCLGSMAICLLEDDKPKQEAYLRRVIRTMPLYLEGMMSDGTCPEGLSYYSYGMAYFIGFADQLYTYSRGKTDLLDNPLVARIAVFQQKCFFDGGCTVSFSDGDRRDKFRLGLTCYLAMRYQGVAIPPMESVMKLHDDTCYRFMALYRDSIWTERFLKQSSLQQTDGSGAEGDGNWFSILPDAQWAVGKSDNGAGMAIKGGHNGEPHNHNDVGSFLYVKGREVFLADLGCGEYTREYFGDGRYRILCNRSLGHSVPLVNGEEQQTGQEYRAESFAARESENRLTGKVEISMSQAYKRGSLDAFTRSAAFEKENGRLLITDTFNPSRASRTVVENFVTQIEPVIQDRNTVILSGKEDCVRIRMVSWDKEEQTDTKTGGWNVVKESFVNHKGVTEAVWLLQWELPCLDKETACTVEIGV